MATVLLAIFLALLAVVEHCRGEWARSELRRQRRLCEQEERWKRQYQGERDAALDEADRLEKQVAVLGRQRPALNAVKREMIQLGHVVSALHDELERIDGQAHETD